jgi:RimJ/RimL family protein N-acetyltransferase
MEHLFRDLKIRKITAGTLKPNTSMIKIMENTGMHLESKLLKHYLFNENEEDVLCYAKFANS